MKQAFNALVVLGCLAFLFVHGEIRANGENGRSHSADSHGHMGHEEMAHGKIELSGSQYIPIVDMRIHKDSMKGWNIQVITKNFRFAPEHASTKHIPGEGHAHLYINGKKITRLYSEWYYLGTLSPGIHEIEVTLNSNSHDDFTVNGKTISDIEIITVPEK